MQQFLNKVDLRKGPIERTVRMIVRLKAPDWNTKKNERKEFIYYTEDWSAKDWLGIPIDPFSEHIEGKYTEVLMKPKLDERTGEHVDNVFAGTRESYYIPFSKKNVDEIIENSAHSDKWVSSTLSSSAWKIVQMVLQCQPETSSPMTCSQIGVGINCKNTSIGQ